MFESLISGSHSHVVVSLKCKCRSHSSFNKLCTLINLTMNSPEVDSGQDQPDVGHYARQLTAAEVEKLKNEKPLDAFKQKTLEINSKKNWDLFYKRNKTKFFKDRHWTTREFNELTDKAVEGIEKPVLLEVGCGVGNFIFPLIEEKTPFFIYACDFSPRAIEFLKENELFSEEVCNAFVHDVTCEDLSNKILPNSVDVSTLIFVLSAIHPEKMINVLKNIYKILKPGGLLLIRDYGLYDQAMLRFGPGHKLENNFYWRQDGTRAYYFSEEYLEKIAVEAGYKIISNKYVTRQTINVKENISVPRIFIQGKLQKPEKI